MITKDQFIEEFQEQVNQLEDLIVNHYPDVREQITNNMDIIFSAICLLGAEVKKLT